MSTPGTTFKKFRPADGHEGEQFMEGWCRRCSRHSDAVEDGGGCQVLHAAEAHAIDENEYPEELFYDLEGQPVCSAMVPF